MSILFKIAVFGLVTASLLAFNHGAQGTDTKGRNTKDWKTANCTIEQKYVCNPQKFIFQCKKEKLSQYPFSITRSNPSEAKIIFSGENNVIDVKIKIVGYMLDTIRFTPTSYISNYGGLVDSDGKYTEMELNLDSTITTRKGFCNFSL